MAPNSPIAGIRWTTQDRHGYEIYLTHERWAHIVEHHPEMDGCTEMLRATLQSGNRKQDTLNPQKYRYTKAFGGLEAGNTHVVAIVLFRFKEASGGGFLRNNYVVTAYQKVIG
jgi:hypothetical protein